MIMKNEQRIWNKSELEQMDEWAETQHYWFDKNLKFPIKKSMLGKSVQWCKDNGYYVSDEMIAKTETELAQEAVTQANDKLQERLDKGEIGVTLENGTILKVGERYKIDSWKNNEYIKILAIGETKIFVIDDTEQEDTWDINLEYEFIPYTEPKEEPKPLEGYQEYFVLTNKGSLTRGLLNDEQLKEMQEMIHGDIRKIYTRQEVIEAGLTI